MTPWQKILAAMLAMLLHVPLFWQLREGLQHGERNADTASQSGVTLKLAARPAPAPPTSAAPPAVVPAKPASKPKPQPKSVIAPSAEVEPKPPEANTRESSQEQIEEEGSEQEQQAIGGQTLGLGGAAASGADEDTLALYKGIIHSRIQRLHQYPQQARMRNQQGTVEVTFTIDADGSIANYHISRSSGSLLLDRAAERLFSRLKLPPPDPSILSNLTMLTVPVTFELDGL